MEDRIVEMLKTALPYAAPDFRKPMQVYIQAKELSDYINNEKESAEVEACGMDNVGNIEGLMEALRMFCTAQEREMIDTALNFMRANRMYQSYKGYVAANGRRAGGNDMMDFLMSRLTPEQQNLFAQMNSATKSE